MSLLVRFTVEELNTLEDLLSLDPLWRRRGKFRGEKQKLGKIVGCKHNHYIKYGRPNGIQVYKCKLCETRFTRLLDAKE